MGRGARATGSRSALTAVLDRVTEAAYLPGTPSELRPVVSKVRRVLRERGFEGPSFAVHLLPRPWPHTELWHRPRVYFVFGWDAAKPGELCWTTQLYGHGTELIDSPEAEALMTEQTVDVNAPDFEDALRDVLVRAEETVVAFFLKDIASWLTEDGFMRDLVDTDSGSTQSWRRGPSVINLTVHSARTRDLENAGTLVWSMSAAGSRTASGVISRFDRVDIEGFESALDALTSGAVLRAS